MLPISCNFLQKKIIKTESTSDLVQFYWSPKTKIRRFFPNVWEIGNKKLPGCTGRRVKRLLSYPFLRLVIIPRKWVTNSYPSINVHKGRYARRNRTRVRRGPKGRKFVQKWKGGRPNILKVKTEYILKGKTEYFKGPKQSKQKAYHMSLQLLIT